MPPKQSGAATITAAGGGYIADRIGARAASAARAAVYVGGYVVLALGPHSPALLLLSFLLAGVGIGFAETAGSTTVAQLLPDHLRGNGFGVLGVVKPAAILLPQLSSGPCGAVVSPPSDLLTPPDG